MTGRPLIGLVAALFVEGRHWVRLRWDFNESSYESAWQLSFVMMALAGVVIWLDESRYTAVLVLMSWLPVLLLPVQFVQSYGLRDSVDLSAFSLFAKRSRLRNERLGLMIDPVRFNFGNVLLVVCLLAATIGISKESQLFLPGLMALCSWVLLATGRCRWTSLLPVMLLAGLLGLAGQKGLERLEKILRSGGGEAGNQFDPNFHTTLIGSRGRVLLSPEVLWRLKVAEGLVPPRLLRTATFRNFLGTTWQNQRRNFVELDSEIVNEVTYHPLHEGLDAGDFDGLPSYALRGSVQEPYPLPIPGDAAGLRGFTDQKVEINPLGTVQVIPDKPVVDCTVYWGAGTDPESGSEQADLLRMTLGEREAVRRVAQELGLRDLPTLDAKLARLREWFRRNFSYSLDLTIHQPTHAERVGKAMKPSAIEQFLTDVRAGHCEYFATAAVLILGESGLQSRYAIGYAVLERDGTGGDYLIRGTHAHAWCRVWDGQTSRWIDFDPTPPDWFASFPPKPSILQGFKDGLKRLREDFYLWRTDPENELMVIVVVSAMGLGLSGFVVRRLWRSRNPMDPSAAREAYRVRGVRTPLHELERLLRRHLGPRPEGRTYVQWLAGLDGSFEDPDLLKEVIALHQQLRFDPKPAAKEVHEQLAESVHRLEIRLKGMLAG